MEIIKFFDTYINSINGIRAILGAVELLILAGIAIFAYRCFNRVVNIDISEKKVYRFENRRYAILSVSIKNISRVSLTRPKIIITNFIYRNDLLNYLGSKGIKSIGELVPIIGIDKLDKEIFKLFLNLTFDIKEKLDNYSKNKWRNLLKKFFTVYKKTLLKKAVKSIFDKNDEEIKKISKNRKHLIEEFCLIYDVLCEYIEQFKLNNKNLDAFFKYIVSVSSERVLKTSKRIIPNENMVVDRLYIFYSGSFMHLGAQLRFGRIKKGRRTSTTFAGIEDF